MKNSILILFFITTSIFSQKKESIFFNPVINPSLQISNHIGIGLGSVGVVFDPGSSLFSEKGIFYKELLFNMEMLFGKPPIFAPNIGFQLMNFDFIKTRKRKNFIFSTSFTFGNLNYINFKNRVDGRIYLEINFGSWIMVGYRFAQPTYGITDNNIGKHTFVLRYYFPLFFTKFKPKVN
ncbi:MAG: hypothetical protein ACRCR9_05350 [Chitinophagaceae bacterium]